MAWAKDKTKTLTGSGPDIEVTGLSSKKFNQILSHAIPSTDAFQDFTFNSSSASVYAQRKSLTGGVDATAVSQALIDMRFNATEEYFHVMYSCWISGEEKLTISHMASFGTAGAANAPNRGEYAFKYVPSPDENLTGVKLNKGTKTNYAIDSNLTVLSTD